MNESGKKETWSKEDFDRFFDEAVEKVFGSQVDASDSGSRLYGPETPEELRKILDQPHFKYTRYEEDDLSWLSRVSQVMKSLP